MVQGAVFGRFDSLTHGQHLRTHKPQVYSCNNNGKVDNQCITTCVRTRAQETKAWYIVAIFDRAILVPLSRKSLAKMDYIQPYFFLLKPLNTLMLL